VRVRVFVDYWNLQLSLNEREAAATRTPRAAARFKLDWRAVGPWLAAKACDAASIARAHHSFDGVIIYASYNPASDASFRKWATTWLNRQPGVQVQCLERKPRSVLRCPSCHELVDTCPHCSNKIVSTVEKGVDTLIATDMIRLAWENAFDLAVLATSDADLVPAVQFLNLKGHRVIQGFPPAGTDLATACWASFDVFRDRAQIRRL
jgi:hypothetical protein